MFDTWNFWCDFSSTVWTHQFLDICHFTGVPQVEDGFTWNGDVQIHFTVGPRNLKNGYTLC